MSDTDPEPAHPQPPPGLLIRAVRENDCEAINAISNMPGFRAGTLRLPFARLEETRAWYAGLKPGDVALSAELDGTLVGNAEIARCRGRRAHVGLLGMGVHDGFVGRGIGTALLAALVEAADDWLDITRIELSVYTDNAAAIRLYERFGFEREGIQRRSSLRAGRYTDTLAMARLRF